MYRCTDVPLDQLVFRVAEQVVLHVVLGLPLCRSAMFSPGNEDVRHQRRVTAAHILLGRRLVGREAIHVIAELLDLGIVVAEAASLVGAAGRVGLVISRTSLVTRGCSFTPSPIRIPPNPVRLRGRSMQSTYLGVEEQDNPLVLGQLPHVHLVPVHIIQLETLGQHVPFLDLAARL